MKIGDRVKIIRGGSEGQIGIIHTATRHNPRYPYGVILDEESKSPSCCRPNEDWVPNLVVLENSKEKQ